MVNLELPLKPLGFLVMTALFISRVFVWFLVIMIIISVIGFSVLHWNSLNAHRFFGVFFLETSQLKHNCNADRMTGRNLSQ